MKAVTFNDTHALAHGHSGSLCGNGSHSGIYWRAWREREASRAKVTCPACRVAMVALLERWATIAAPTA